MIKVLGLALYGDLAASTRYRLVQYKRKLFEHGIDLEIYSLLNNNYLSYRFSGKKLPLTSLLRSTSRRLENLLQQKTYDCAICYCELYPLMPGWLEECLIRIPYIYDFDDAFYLKYKANRFSVFAPLLSGKIDRIIKNAAAVCAGSTVLKTYAEDLNPNTIFLPTVVDTGRYLIEKSKKDEKFTVGWIGSPSTARYLEKLVEPLSILGDEGAVRLVVIGGRAPEISNVEVEEVVWSEESEINQINRFHVGVMPLFDNEWTRGKCGFKLIQYMACGVPVIASPVGANSDIVDSSCGYLARSTPEWVQALRFYRDNPVGAESMGQIGRERIEEYYSLNNSLPVMADLIKSIL